MTPTPAGRAGRHPSAIIAAMADLPPLPPITPVISALKAAPARADDERTVCERCGAEMFRSHAVWRCPACRFKTDCCGW